MTRCHAQVLVLSLVLAGVPAVQAAALEVPLEIRETRGQDWRSPGFQLLPGHDRVGEPVTFGLPVAAAEALCSTAGLTIPNHELQTRVLRRRDDGLCGGAGSIEWLLLDTRVDLPAGGSATPVLTEGTPPPAAPDLAVDGGGVITVDTGAATFTIRKQGFNLLDSVAVGGTELVAGGASAGLELIAGGVAYHSADDPASDVAIEENGPLRAVVVARGALRSGAGDGLLDYTVRLHFHRGHGWCRALVTLRNASLGRQQHVAFDSLELVVATSLAGAGATVATHQGPVATSLSGTHVVSLFQGETAFPVFRDYDFDDYDGQGHLIRDKWPTLVEGYTIHRDATLLATGNRDQVVDPFWLELATPGGRLTAATRFAAGWWPQGLRASGDGTVRVGLFPVGNDRPFWARFTGHVTREVLLDFGAGPAPDPAARPAMFQYPLAGKAADPAYYDASGALWERMLAVSEQRAWYAAQGWPTGYPDDWRPDFHLTRHFYWGTGGGRNQYDQAKVQAWSFLRENAPWAGVWWLEAEQRFAYNADLAVYHSDDFDGADPSAADFNYLPGIEHIPYAKAVFEGEHFHSYGLSLWYYLTGDERLREAYEDLGEYLLHPVVAGYDVEARGVAWHVFNLVDLFRFTGDTVYRDAAWTLLRDEVLDKQAELGVSEGTDPLRGFYAAVTDTFDFYNSGLPWPDRQLASFVSGAMHPRSWAYFEAFGAADPLQADRARDALEGVSLFVAREHWHEYGPDPGDYGFPYRQGADTVPPDPRPDGEWVGGAKEVWPALYWGWVLTGDDELLRRGRLLERTMQGAFTDEFQDWPDRQTFEHLLLHPGQHARWVALPLTASDLGSGAWRLSWTVPAGAEAYWIKHSDREIVPWLGFDPASRSYAVDPATHTPFFAADNVVGEPAPGPPGSTQTMTVSGLAPGATPHFAGRVRLAPAALSAIFEDGFETGTTAAWSAAIGTLAAPRTPTGRRPEARNPDPLDPAGSTHAAMLLAATP